MTSYVIYQVNKVVSESYDREKQAKGLAMKDFLTNLPNRLSLSKYCNSNAVLDEFGQTFYIGMFDVDDFKKINDSKGHIYGDSVLVNLAHIISTNISKKDFACRYGGEEFVIILANCDMKQAMSKSNKIRTEFKQLYSSNDKITISGGISSYDHSLSMFDNINLADKNMYTAKKTGKNKVVSNFITT
jgi:diguanylate cyclase (GGDEF)-like protein